MSQLLSSDWQYVRNKKYKGLSKLEWKIYKHPPKFSHKYGEIPSSPGGEELNKWLRWSWFEGNHGDNYCYLVPPKKVKEFEKAAKEGYTNITASGMCEIVITNIRNIVEKQYNGVGKDKNEKEIWYESFYGGEFYSVSFDNLYNIHLYVKPVPMELTPIFGKGDYYILESHHEFQFFPECFDINWVLEGKWNCEFETRESKKKMWRVLRFVQERLRKKIKGRAKKVIEEVFPVGVRDCVGEFL